MAGAAVIGLDIILNPLQYQFQQVRFNFKFSCHQFQQNTGQYADELKAQVEEKDTVIEDLNKAIVDQELTIKQMESVRENSNVKLQNALVESEVSKMNISSHREIKKNKLIKIDTHSSPDDIFKRVGHAEIIFTYS